MSAASEQKETDTIIFDVTASTNVVGARIVIHREGAIDFLENQHNLNAQAKALTGFSVQKNVVDELFKTLNAVWPLQSSGRSAIKSASFGHYAYVTYMGARSADLDTWLLNPEIKKLKADLNKILEGARNFYIKT